MFEFLPLLTAIVVFALPYGVGLLANKYKADLSTPDTRKGNAWMFAKGGIIAGLFFVQCWRYWCCVCTAVGHRHHE